MIFIGDIALPYSDAVKVDDIPAVLRNKNWFANLEGAIVNSSLDQRQRSIVYNDKSAIDVFLSHFNVSGFALANNHIFDTGSLSETIHYLESKNVPYCGIGNTLAEASRPLFLKEDSAEIVILNFGWEVIQCEITDGNYQGVNPLVKRHVLESIQTALDKYPGSKIIPFFHWSYELEAEPQPFERELAKNLIEMGVAGVIGAHPHRIGGFEMYRGKPIIYSLGNWMFKQNYFFNSRLKFPDFCNRELALEWDFENDEIKFHFFNYDRVQSILTYSHTEDSNGPTMAAYTPFGGLSNNEYRKWYRKNHYHRRKGLPVYYWDDSELIVNIKNRVNSLRDSVLHLLLKFR
jgi:hypothetical protein